MKVGTVSAMSQVVLRHHGVITTVYQNQIFWGPSWIYRNAQGFSLDIHPISITDILSTKPIGRIKVGGVSPKYQLW